MDSAMLSIQLLLDARLGLFCGGDKDYIVQIAGQDLILSIVPETFSLVCTI